MKHKSLLPPNGTELEQAIEKSMNIHMLAVKVANNPITAPVNFLPFLAQQFSVDVWDDLLTEQEKRESIVQSVAIHKHKGTVLAVKKALSVIFEDSAITEFTGNRAFEFDVHVTLKADGNAVYEAEKYALARKVANETKNERSRFVNFNLKMPDAKAEINESTGAIFNMQIANEINLTGTAEHHINTSVYWQLDFHN